MLLQVVLLNHYPKVNQNVTYRMIEHPPEASFETTLIDPSTKYVVVDIDGAGIYPAQVCYEMLSLLCESSKIRQDHIYTNRRVNEKGQVIGNTFAGSKIGGDIADSIVLFPDPMGASSGGHCFTVKRGKQRARGEIAGE